MDPGQREGGRGTCWGLSWAGWQPGLCLSPVHTAELSLQLAGGWGAWDLGIWVSPLNGTGEELWGLSSQGEVFISAAGIVFGPWAETTGVVFCIKNYYFNNSSLAALPQSCFQRNSGSLGTLSKRLSIPNSGMVWVGWTLNIPAMGRDILQYQLCSLQGSRDSQRIPGNSIPERNSLPISHLSLSV